MSRNIVKRNFIFSRNKFMYKIYKVTFFCLKQTKENWTNFGRYTVKKKCFTLIVLSYHTYTWEKALKLSCHFISLNLRNLQVNQAVVYELI